MEESIFVDSWELVIFDNSKFRVNLIGDKSYFSPLFISELERGEWVMSKETKASLDLPDFLADIVGSKKLRTVRNFDELMVKFNLEYYKGLANEDKY